MKHLPNVTLVGIDCVDINRLIHVSRICQKRMSFGGVKLFTSLPANHESIVPIANIQSEEEYSRFVIKDLAKHITTKFLLLVQHDGYILNPDAWDDTFLKYDYIGAPWAKEDKNVGNGGFSLRSRRLMKLVSEDICLDKYYPEDGIICREYRSYLETKGMVFAPEAIAAKFSFEANHKYGLAWNGQFGFHSYCTNLSNWKPLKYSNPVVDYKFLFNFFKQTRNRYKINIDQSVIEKICGEYVCNNNGVEEKILIRSSGSKLRYFSSSLADIIFHPIDERTYFSDKINAIIKMNKNDQNQSILLTFLNLTTSTTTRHERVLSEAEFQEVISLYRKSYLSKKNSFGGFENL